MEEQPPLLPERRPEVPEPRGHRCWVRGRAGAAGAALRGSARSWPRGAWNDGRRPWLSFKKPISERHGLVAPLPHAFAGQFLCAPRRVRPRPGVPGGLQSAVFQGPGPVLSDVARTRGAFPFGAAWDPRGLGRGRPEQSLALDGSRKRSHVLRLGSFRGVFSCRLWRRKCWHLLRRSPRLPGAQGGVARPPSATRRTPSGHLPVRPNARLPPGASHPHRDAVATKCTGFSVAVPGDDQTSCLRSSASTSCASLPGASAGGPRPGPPASGGRGGSDRCAPGLASPGHRPGCCTWSAAEGRGPGGSPGSVAKCLWCPGSRPSGCPPGSA